MDLYATRAGQMKSGSWLGGKTGAAGAGNILLHNLGDWQFADETQRSGTEGGNRSVFTAAWLDVDNDDWPDLYVINEFGNGILLSNQRNGTFRTVELSEGPSDYGSMGITVGDVDNDGRIDMYLSNMYSKAGKRVIGNLRPDTYSPQTMNEMHHFVEGSQLVPEPGQPQVQEGRTRSADRRHRLGLRRRSRGSG